MVDEVNIARKLPLIEKLVLIAKIDIQVLVESLVDTKKESILVDSCTGPFGLALSKLVKCADRIEVDENFVEDDERPILSLRNGNIRAE